MTVTYTAEVATCRGFGCFLTLLLRWRGSIYKLVWPDLALFLFLYYSLNFTYRYALNSEQRVVFEKVSEYCETYSNYIPLSFVLGFYISIIMQRWWDQYITIPWPDPIAVYVSAHIHGQDERGRLMRRTIMRYVCLCLTMVFSMICPRVKKRFPTYEHFVEAGLMTDNEKSIIMDLNMKFPNHNKQWLPIVWAASIVTRARKEGRIRDDFSVKTIIDELNLMRSKCGRLLNYDSISVPLVYTQVVTLATYSFFITSVIGRQWLDVPDNSPLRSRSNPIDLYFPVFTCLQFFFYMGWLKVAESLINPFGEDDDDFEINWIVDRNIVVSYLIVDEMHHEHPELIKDQYWDQVFPTELPHTAASQPFKERVPQPSTANIAVSSANTEFINPTSGKMDDLGLVITDDMREDNQSGIHFLAGRSASRMSMSGGQAPGGWTRVRTVSGGSMTSMNQLGSQGTSLHRVGSVASVIKRLFSRDPASTPVVDGPILTGGGGSATGGGGGGRLPESLSNVSLSKMAPSVAPSAGPAATRITDQVIEEVDEQATITSTMGKPPEIRPSAMSIFQSQLTVSDPVPVPPGGSKRPVSTGLGMSTANSLPPTVQVSPTTAYPDSVRSAPGFDNYSGSYYAQRDSISIGSSTEPEDEDEFTKLKEARKREMERIMLARSISVIAGGGGTSPPLLASEADDDAIALLDMTTDSKSALLSSPPGSAKPT